MLVKTKKLLFSVVALLTGWFAATHVSGTQSRYAQDVADYQAAATGDSLPTQARLTKSRSQALIELVGATTRFRETEAPRLPEVLAASKQNAGGRIGVIEKLLTTAFRYIGVPYRSGQSGPTLDCSGLPATSIAKITSPSLAPRVASYTEGSPVASVSEMRKGDLVFFGGRGGRNGVGHVRHCDRSQPLFRQLQVHPRQHFFWHPRRQLHRPLFQ